MRQSLPASSSAEGLVFGFDLVLDGRARHDAVEFLHGGADAGGEAATATTVAALAPEIVDHRPDERDRNADEKRGGED